MTRLLNRNTGAVIEIDPHAARLGRMRRRVWEWSNVVEQWRAQNNLSMEAKMITCTYRPSVFWKPNHIRDFMKAVRKFCDGKLAAYCWVAEIQRRGAIHYHVILAAPEKLHLPHPDKAGWWPHGSTNVRKVDHYYYVMKYVQKGNDGENSYPSGARIFATWFPRNIQVNGETGRNWSVSPYPRWVSKRLLDSGGDLVARPAAGGGWLIGGKVIHSEYTFLGM